MENFNIIWNEYQEYLKSFCSIKLSSFPDIAEEVLNDTYLAYIDAVKSGRVILYPKAWLYQTANNIIIKKYADLKNQRDNNISIDAVVSETVVLTYEPDLSDLIITEKEIEDMADEILSEFSEEDRKVLQLFHKDKLSFKEIAKIIGKSEASVKQRNYRVSNKIRKMVFDKFNP